MIMSQDVLDNSVSFKLQSQDLCLWYGKFQALNNINISIKPKCITAIIGPSGCGKSTLLRCFNRMNELIPYCRVTGSVKLDGQDIYTTLKPESLRKRVGMVFQRPNPFPISVFDNIAYGPRVHGIKNQLQLLQIVESSLKATALWNQLKDKLHIQATNLTPEQQQRLCISRAIAMAPEVLLMDEPCSTLDPIATAHIEELMRELCSNYTIVIVTHNMQQAARISHYTGFMLLGNLIEFGPTEKIFTNPEDKRTDEYITGRYG